MPAIPLLAGAAITAGGNAIAANQAKKAAQGAANTVANSVKPVDIAALNQQVSQQSINNARASQALEQQLNPQAAALRTQGLTELLMSLQEGSPYADQVQAVLMEQFGSPAQQSDLSRAAYDQAAADLALGASIPLDVANQIVRSSAARSGTVSGNLGLGRDISARDLGLTSLDLRNQRLGTAAQLGGARDAFGLNSRQQQALVGQQVANLEAQGLNRLLQLAQFGQNIQQPTVGLDPSSIANIMVGNQNQQQAATANAAAIRAQGAGTAAGLYGQGAGMVGSALTNYLATPKAAPAPAVNMQPYTNYFTNNALGPTPQVQFGYSAYGTN